RISEDRPGAQASHRGLGDRVDAARLPFAYLRPDPGHGDQGTLGIKARGLSCHSRTPGARRQSRPSAPSGQVNLLAKLSRLPLLRFAVIGALGLPVDAGVL